VSLSLFFLYNWPAVGWIQGEVVKRNVDNRMKIGSDIVNFFVLYKHDDDTSKHVFNLYLGTLGEGKKYEEDRQGWSV